MANDHDNAALRAGDENVAPRVGVYICHCGGNISDVVDVEAVAKAAGELPNVVVAKTNMFMCSDPGQQAIADDIATQGVNRVVVAACSTRLHELTFRGVLERAGVNPYLLQQANIREQVSWSTHDHAQATTKAIALVRAAVAKASRLQPLEPIRIDAEAAVVVVGGGVAGLRAADDLARAGLNVTIVERAPVLGGRAAVLDRVFPNEEPVGDIVSRLAEAVLGNERIVVHTSATVEKAGGYVGAFTLRVRQGADGVTVKGGVRGHGSGPAWRYAPFRGYEPVVAVAGSRASGVGEARAGAGGNGTSDNGTSGDGTDGADEREFTVKAGAVIVATGYEHYTPPKGEYGYDPLPHVMTLVDFIRWLSEAPSGKAPQIDGKPVRAAAFIHCVGSRQVEGVHKPGPSGGINEYCSRVCCTATLQAMSELRDKFPSVAAYDFYQDIRAYGRGHEDYYERAAKAGAIFFRYDGAQPPRVAKAPADDPFPVTVSCTDSLTWGEEVEVGVDLVVLAVGMTAADVGALASDLKLPVSADGFLQEVHPKLRPVEVSVAGVLVAGACQAPKDITESCASASAAAVKAVGLLAKGHVDLDPYVAHVDTERCVGTGACVQECPYEGAITLVEFDDGVKRASVNPALCAGCGACVAVCPTRAVDLSGWSLETYEAMVDAILETGTEVPAR